MVEKLTEAEVLELRVKANADLDSTLHERGFHPVVKPVLARLHDDNASWRQETTEGLFREVVVMIEEVGRVEGVDRMCDAVATLISFSNEMNRREASQKAAIVVHVACHRVIETHNLMEAVRKKAFQPSDPTVAALLVSGAMPADRAARAPKLGEKPPLGSVKPGALAPPKRRI